MYKANYRYEVVGTAKTYEEAEQLIIAKYGEFDWNYAFIELL